MGQSAFHPIFLQNSKLANPELGEETLQSPSPAEENGLLAFQSSLCLAERLFLWVCYMCVFSHCPTPQQNKNTFFHLLILFAMLEISPLLSVALEIVHAFKIPHLLEKMNPIKIPRQ